MKLRAIVTGAAAFALLLALYFLLVGLVSGREYALEQFATYWYFLISLAAGFGIQMGLAFNLAGIAYIVPKVMQASKEHARCAVPA